MREGELVAGTMQVETEGDRIHCRRWWTLLVLSLSTLVVSMKANVLTVALPTIQAELSATVTHPQWVVNIYMMIVGSLPLSFGALTDRWLPHGKSTRRNKQYMI